MRVSPAIGDSIAKFLFPPYRIEVRETIQGGSVFDRLIVDVW